MLEKPSEFDPLPRKKEHHILKTLVYAGARTTKKVLCFLDNAEFRKHFSEKNDPANQANPGMPDDNE